MIAILFAILVCNAASADVLFTYGFSPRTIALGGAFTGIADDFGAAYYNPGGLIQGDTNEVGLGYMLTDGDLKVESRSGIEPELESTKGVIFGFNLPIPFRSWLERRLFFGFSCFFPEGVLLSIEVPYPTEPQYLLLQNSGRMISLVPTLAVRLANGLGIGGGAQLFDNTSGQIKATADPYGNIVADVGEELTFSYAPLFGVFIDPGYAFYLLDGLRLGFVWRDSFYTHYKFPVNTYIGDVPLTAAFDAISLYMPEQYVFGTSYRLSERILASVDISYNKWSEFPDPNLDIEVDMEIPILPITFQNSEKIEPNLHDTITVRAGIESVPYASEGMDLIARAGYFYDPSPVPAQSGITNYLDTDRHVFSAGAGVKVRKMFGFFLKNPFSLDVALQYQHLVERTFKKHDWVDPSNPGYPEITMSGSLWCVALTYTLWYDLE